jgi:hypothetical protein
MAETPSGTGGRPAISAIKLHQLSICFMSSVGSLSNGVHEARISISASSFRGESFPNDALVTLVTVPLGALNSHSFFQVIPRTNSNLLQAVVDLLA